MGSKVVGTKFTAGAKAMENLPRAILPEIAVIGRSNVGKSTFINRLANNAKLARTSSTPGRTQEINLFEFELAIASKRKKVTITDLPGFGYAKFSKDKREELSRLTVEYISQRDQLRVVCLLNDCRRMPEREEIAIRDLTFSAEKHCVIIVTKMDKLSRNEARESLKKISAAYGLMSEDLLTSSKDGKADMFWPRVLACLTA